MIIELHSPQNDNTLFTAWEIPEYAWEKRKDFIMKLFHQYFIKYQVNVLENEWQDNIVFHVVGNEHQFNRTEKVFNKYFSSIRVLNVVN